MAQDAPLSLNEVGTAFALVKFARKPTSWLPPLAARVAE